MLSIEFVHAKHKVVTAVIIKKKYHPITFVVLKRVKKYIKLPQIT